MASLHLVSIESIKLRQSFSTVSAQHLEASAQPRHIQARRSPTPPFPTNSSLHRRTLNRQNKRSDIDHTAAPSKPTTLSIVSNRASFPGLPVRLLLPLPPYSAVNVPPAQQPAGREHSGMRPAAIGTGETGRSPVVDPLWPRWDRAMGRGHVDLKKLARKLLERKVTPKNRAEL
jgi:hypothetical protein